MDPQEGVTDDQTVSTDTHQEPTDTSSHVNVAFSSDDIDSEHGRTADCESEEAHNDASSLSLDQSKKNASEEEVLNVTEGDLGHIGPGILEFDGTPSDIGRDECVNSSIQINIQEQNGTVGFVIPKKNGNVPTTTTTKATTPNDNKETPSTQVCTYWLMGIVRELGIVYKGNSSLLELHLRQVVEGSPGLVSIPRTDDWVT